MTVLTPRQLRFAKAVVFILCLLPLVYTVYAAVTENLGTDPVKSLIHISGEWAIRLFVLTLAISPMRAWLGWGGCFASGECWVCILGFIPVCIYWLLPRTYLAGTGS